MKNLTVRTASVFCKLRNCFLRFAQLIFRLEFLSLDCSQSIFHVLFLPFRLAEPGFGVEPLAFPVLDKRGKGVLNLEKLTLHFGSETSPGRRNVRLRGSDVFAMRGHWEAVLICSNFLHLKRGFECDKLRRAPAGAGEWPNDRDHIAPAFARAMIEVVLCPFSSGTKMTFPP